MNRKVAFVCLAAMASVGCATAELVNPTPLAPCDATNDCPLPDSGPDAPSDAPAASDAAGDTSPTDAADAATPADTGATDAADADAKG
jgi:hypothetical protein